MRSAIMRMARRAQRVLGLVSCTGDDVPESLRADLVKPVLKRVEVEQIIERAAQLSFARQRQEEVVDDHAVVRGALIAGDDAADLACVAAELFIGQPFEAVEHTVRIIPNVVEVVPQLLVIVRLDGPDGPAARHAELVECEGLAGLDVLLEELVGRFLHRVLRSHMSSYDPTDRLRVKRSATGATGHEPGAAEMVDRRLRPPAR